MRLKCERKFSDKEGRRINETEIRTITYKDTNADRALRVSPIAPWMN